MGRRSVRCALQSIVVIGVLARAWQPPPQHLRACVRARRHSRRGSTPRISAENEGAADVDGTEREAAFLAHPSAGPMEDHHGVAATPPPPQHPPLAPPKPEELPLAPELRAALASPRYEARLPPKWSALLYVFTS